VNLLWFDSVGHSEVYWGILTSKIELAALFAVGAFVPLLPFILLTGFTALAVSIALTAVALFSVGAAVSLLTGKSAIYTGLRQLAIGAAAAAITYAVGSLIGVNV
jgi:VIT1/CCC1 family predicted Fe2+/Mn2+ transporter